MLVSHEAVHNGTGIQFLHRSLNHNYIKLTKQTYHSHIGMPNIQFRLTNQETTHARICQTPQKNQLFFHFLYLEYMFTSNIQKQTIYRNQRFP